MNNKYFIIYIMYYKLETKPFINKNVNYNKIINENILKEALFTCLNNIAFQHFHI